MLDVDLLAGPMRDMTGSGDEVEAARSALRDARRVLVLTGAGVSAESGIPTFRGEDGWWKRRDPMELATPEAFGREPDEVWAWYDYRRRLIADAEPNAAHRALAGWAGDGREVRIITQNVDDLHERAGSDDVIHIHGSIWRVRCTGCGAVYEDRRAPLPELPPTCDRCGDHPVRPDVVWFGESLPAAELRRVQAVFDRGAIDLALVIGTEAVFGYIRQWAELARRAGAMLVEVNPSRTGLSGIVDLRMAGKAGEVLGGLGDGDAP